MSNYNELMQEARGIIESYSKPWEMDEIQIDTPKEVKNLLYNKDVDIKSVVADILSVG